ncbi:MAG TPA: cytochrome C [Ignavibacteria bacterium]|nr:cytochrome C [Ignavibacteria bacterium]
MKKLLKITAVLFTLIIVLLISGYAYISLKFPDVGPAPDIRIVSTPEKIERGKYLANSFGACMDCHSKRDFDKLGGPLIPGTEGMGGEDFGEGAGFIPARNITSDKETGIGSWTDGEIFRAITMGVDKNGNALAPMMPYLYYRNIDAGDVEAVIAYIRTLPPIKNQVPEHKINFPVSLIFKTLPSKPDFNKFPEPDNKIATGYYYSGNCMGCHSPMEKGEFIEDKLFSGGTEFPNPKGGIIRSANITPDKETGIGSWTKEQFIQKFRTYTQPEVQNVTVHNGEFNTVMPWTFLANATDEDLGSVFDFLMTQKPVYNKVEKYDPTGRMEK